MLSSPDCADPISCLSTLRSGLAHHAHLLPPPKAAFARPSTPRPPLARDGQQDLAGVVAVAVRAIRSPHTGVARIAIALCIDLFAAFGERLFEYCGACFNLGNIPGESTRRLHPSHCHLPLALCLILETAPCRRRQRGQEDEPDAGAAVARSGRRQAVARAGR